MPVSELVSKSGAIKRAAFRIKLLLTRGGGWGLKIDRGWSRESNAKYLQFPPKRLFCACHFPFHTRFPGFQPEANIEFLRRSAREVVKEFISKASVKPRRHDINNVTARPYTGLLNLQKEST